MKRVLLLFFGLFCLSTLAVNAQTLQAGPNLPLRPGNSPGFYHTGQRVACGVDTVGYPGGKSTGLRLLSMNTATSGQGLYQYYDCPQSMTLHGFNFYGYAPSATTPVNVICEVYLAGPDSLPMGLPLASDTVPVDSNYGLLTLPDLQRSATFGSGITLTQDFILTVINPTAQNVSVLTNDWDTNDGQQEWLSGADFSNMGGSWTRGHNVNVGGTPFDCDVFLYPHVTYDMVAQFTADRSCIQAGDTVRFTNYSSPVVSHRMYNMHVFDNNSQEFGWNRGDGSAIVFTYEPTHVYAGTGPYTVILYNTLLGWTSLCTDNVSHDIGGTGEPSAQFLNNHTGAIVNLTDISVGATNWSWNFGDGNTSSTQNPTHVYGANGTYVITLIAGNTCGADTTTDTVTVNCDRPVADFGWVRNFFQVIFSDSSQFATSWSWDFGDGSGTSTLQNPSYAYANYGSYEVTLVASSICGYDTIRDSVHITAPVGLADPAREQVRVFPNPTNGQMSIHAPGLSGVSVLDLSGKDVRNLEFSPTDQKTISLQDLTRGVYFLQLKTQTGQIAGIKIIRQ